MSLLRTPVRIRWWIFMYLFLFLMLAYVQQKSLSIAAASIMPELHLSQMQIGWLMFTFTAVYSAMQLPGGILGEWIGARAALVAVGAVSLLATIATPLAPMLLKGTALFVALVLAQALLGAAQGPLNPAIAGTLESWFPKRQWALAQGFNASGGNIGTAFTPLLIVALTSSFGWQGALVWIALPTALLTAAWALYGRNTPREHPRVTPGELADLGEIVSEPKPPLTAARLRKVLTNRDVLLLSISYACMNYVFYLLANWSFLYLIQVRHLSALEGGGLVVVPPIFAALGAWLGGWITDRLSVRLGTRWGYRLVPLVTLPLVGVLLLVVIASGNAYFAVGALTLAFGCVECNEGAYWAGTMAVARADTMAAGGVLNTLGNVGGVIGIPIVASLSGHGHWFGAFAIGTAFAAVAAVLWLLIDVNRHLKPANSSHADAADRQFTSRFG